MVKVHYCSITGGCGETAQIATQLTRTLSIVYWPLVIVCSVLAPQMELLGMYCQCLSLKQGTPLLDQGTVYNYAFCVITKRGAPYV